MGRFNYLNVPDQWRNYWTKYPNGYTILESLMDWISQVDGLIDNINNWNEYLENFVDNFAFELQAEVEKTLLEWQESGFLDVIVGGALQTRIDDIAHNISTEYDLIKAIGLNKKVTCNVGKTVAITKDLTIPQDIILKFNNGGLLYIRNGVTLKMNAQIEAGFYQIFKFESDTAKITTDQVAFGSYGGPSFHTFTKVGYEIHPDWFGAIPDAYPTVDYDYVEGDPLGTDSTKAFKRCMEFAEAASCKLVNLNPARMQPHITVAFRPNSSYLVVGNNPLGVQSTTPNTGYFIDIEGNKSCILWKPLSKTDALFGKYGRMTNPNHSNINVLLIGKQGQRWGSYISTKTNEGDNYHMGVQGIFKNMKLGSFHSATGFDIVFDIDKDNNDSHDDTMTLDQVTCLCYNKFIDFKQTEAVGWYLRKCSLGSGTDNATHIDISDNFSGGLTLDSCDIHIEKPGETFLKVGDNIGLTPINITNGRIETRGAEYFTFIDAKSGDINIDNLQLDAGNDSIPHPLTRSFKVGEKARIAFKSCQLYDNVDVILNKAEYRYNTALQFDNCAFYGKVDSDPRTLGYPTLHYITADTQTEISIGNALKNGYKLRGIVVNNPRYTDGEIGLDIEYGNSIKADLKQTVISKLDSLGFPSLHMTSVVLPPYLVVTSLKLFLVSVNITLVDQIVFSFGADGIGPHAEIIKNLTDNVSIYGDDLLFPYDIITIPTNKPSHLNIIHNKGGVAVKNQSQMPKGWIEITYKGLNKRTELGIDGVTPLRKDRLTMPF